MIEDRQIPCPYCGGVFETQVDCTAGNQSYIEDCQICCQPIMFEIEVGPALQLINLTVHREND